MAPLINILHAYGLKKSVGTCVFSKVTDAAGDHWITVHPNGGGKGQAVLLSKGGEVLGGMGGKFNGMHISSVRGSGDPLTGENVKLQSQKYTQEKRTKWANSEEGKKEYAGWKAEGAAYVQGQIKKGEYRGKKGVERAHRDLYLANAFLHKSEGDFEWRRKRAYMEATAEAMKGVIAKHEQLSQARTAKRLKQQYEQLNLF